jgi:hypothetical protein
MKWCSQSVQHIAVDHVKMHAKPCIIQRNILETETKQKGGDHAIRELHTRQTMPFESCTHVQTIQNSHHPS